MANGEMKTAGWEKAPIVFVVATACPHCSTTSKPEILRTYDNRDGSVTRRCCCRKCGGRYLTVVEPPETGKTD